MKGTLKIHSQNILPIIKKWLYSEKDIFVRELVSNSCDAIRKLKILSDQGAASNVMDDQFKIEITIDKEAKTITFADTGLGMDAEEVEKYIAQIAFSGAEEFVSKYTSNQEKDQIIGHFGLGFYSSYMVAEKVEIQTLSYKEGAESVFWSCDGTSDYEISVGNRTERGTSITLFISKDNEEYLEEAKLKQLLNNYCSFLPYPIFINGSALGNKEPLWNKPALDCTDAEYKELYSKLYPLDEEPLFWVHLNVDYPFNLKGILFFPKIRPGYDYKKSQIKLYCNRVFVSDNCQDLIPEYLMVLKGVIDSPDIPLNVSRSYLQMDKTVRQLSTHISKKVAERLGTLQKTDEEAFFKAWPNIEIIVKLGALQDEKFYERVKELLIWKNESGKWTTLQAYKERNKQEKIFYTPHESHASHFLDVYKKQGIEVLYTDSIIDTALMSHLERKESGLKFQRIDGGLEDVLIDKSKEQTLLDAEGRTEASKLAQLIKSKLNIEQVEVEAKSLATETLPGILVIEEEARRFRDYMSMQMPEMKSIEPKQTFVVNTNSKLINAIPSIEQKDPDLAKELVEQVYDLSLLSQKEMQGEKLTRFIERTSQILEKLTSRL